MSTRPPPILPSPGGWRQPRSLVPWMPSTRVALAGLVLCFVAAYGATVLILAAWQACDVVPAGTRAGWVGLVFPALAIGTWVVFLIGVYFVARSRRALVQLGGVVLAVAALFFFVTVVVPDRAYADRPGLPEAEYPECGPYSVPTWWPSWLPS